MYGHGKSDKPIVSGKPLNKEYGAPCSAEGVEERGPPALGVGRFLTRMRHDWKNIPSLEPPPEASLCPSPVGFLFRSSQPESRARSGEANP
jgi:hypothetical protein